MVLNIFLCTYWPFICMYRGELPVQIIFLSCLQDYLHIQRFAGRTHGTQHTVVLTTKICYSNVVSTDSWITREKDRCSLQDSMLQASLCSLPHVRGHAESLFPQQWKCDSTHALFVPMEVHERDTPKVFIEGGYLSPSAC